MNTGVESPDYIRTVAGNFLNRFYVSSWLRPKPVPHRHSHTGYWTESPFWPLSGGDPCMFGLLGVLDVTDLASRAMPFDDVAIGRQVVARDSLSQGILTAFAWTSAMAYNQGGLKKCYYYSIHLDFQLWLSFRRFHPLQRARSSLQCSASSLRRCWTDLAAGGLPAEFPVWSLEGRGRQCASQCCLALRSHSSPTGGRQVLRRIRLVYRSLFLITGTLWGVASMIESTPVTCAGSIPGQSTKPI